MASPPNGSGPEPCRRPPDSEDTRTALERQLIGASTSALALVQPDVLPNIDRLADLEKWLREPLARFPTPLAVIGDGGFGKSVMLHQVYERIRDTESTSLPILVLCSRVPASADLSDASAVDVALGTAALNVFQPRAVGLTQMVEEVATLRPAVVLLDTVDLILNDVNAGDVASVIKQLAEHARLIFTCRDVEYHNLLASEHGLIRKVYEVPRLDRERIGLWALAFTREANIAAAQRQKFIASLTAPAAVEVCATPLRLAMACQIYGPEGAIPEDLTVTRLYDQYWDQRIAVDRHGKNTAIGRAQAKAVAAVAREIWDLSKHQFAVEASGDLVVDDDALQRICSEGVLKEIGGRYQFFHQTYAEYSVARVLARTGTADDLLRLKKALYQADGGGLWSVAQHLVTLEMSNQRYEQVSASIPTIQPLGLRTRFAGAYHRRDAQLAAELGRTAEQHLMRACVDILAAAPPECVATVADIAVSCLLAATNDDIEKVVTAAAGIYASMPVADRPRFVHRIVDGVLGRRAQVSKESLPSVLRRFIDRTVATRPDDTAVNALVDFYADDTGDRELPAAAQKAVLELVYAHPPHAATQTRLLSTAARRECPSGAVEAVAGLLVHNWSHAEFRAAMNWPDIAAMLEQDLPKRWDACQVRLAEALCAHAETARGVLAVACSDTELRRDRWTDVAKFIADRHGALVLDAILDLPADLGKPAVGTACSVINHMADTMSPEQRRRVADRLDGWIDTDSRRVWPTRVKLSIDDADELRRCAARLADLRASAEPAAAITVNSAFDTFLNACTPTQLVDLQPSLRALMSLDHKPDRERIAELDGLVALEDVSVRERATAHIHSAATNTAFAAGRGLVEALPSWSGADDGQTSAWLYGLLNTRHPSVVRLLATSLTANSSHVLTPTDASTTISHRLIRSLDDRNDPQTAGALLTLLIGIERSQGIDRATRESVVTRLRQRVAELLAMDAADRGRDHLPAVFNLLKESLTALVIPHCSDKEITGLVEDVLTSFDAAAIANRTKRPMAHLLITAARKTEDVLRLVEDLWPTMSDSNKAAIVECVTHLEKNTPGVRSKRIAGRDDCPLTLQNLIYAQFPG